MEFTEFGLQLGIPKDKVEAFASRSLELFSSQADQLEITPGLDPVIRKLSQSANLSIVTGNSCRVVDKFLKANNLKGDFKTILCAEDSGSRVEKILKILSQDGRSNAEGFLIGDAVSDIRSAREAGIKSIAVSWGHQSRAKLAAQNPDFIIDHPDELLHLFSFAG
jgi:phosphoglycolate phosphatase